MWQDFPLIPRAASAFAEESDLLFLFLVLVSIVFSILIGAVIVGFTVVYRRRKANHRGAAIEGSLPLELFWSAIPFALTVIMFVWGARLFFEASRAPGDAMEIYVTGKQWMWKIQHPGGQREINSLHVPIGQPVRLTLATEDVIHSFFVPAFRLKSDVVPGRYTTMWFEANKVGEYHLFCAEYCGAKHSEMIGTVTVMEAADYEQWLSGAPAGETALEAGEKLFASLRCDTCHNDGPNARGPNLENRFGQNVALQGGGSALFDAEYVRESILNPKRHIAAGYQPLMPTYQGQLSEEQILQVITYLKSLSSGGQ